MKNKVVLKIVSGTLLCTMLAYTAPVFAYTKDETVYSKLDSNGKSYNTIVSTHIENNENEELINDLSDLINIENTNGDEKFTQNGTSLVWQSNKNDIYYQGESQKELPVECNVTYTLDGKQVSADDIAGKSGKVTINLQYTNKDEHTVNINGKNVKMYTPFIAVAGTIIQNDNNENITISNGKVVNDGSKSIVMGIALPGMQESLGINKGTLDIPDSIEITMDAKDFESNNIVTFVTPKVLEEKDLKFFDDLDKIYSQVSELQSASNQIKDGADQLVTGANSLKDGVSIAYNGSKQIQTEVEKSTKTLASDKSEALDSKTLASIGTQAASTAASTIKSQQSAIGAQAASTAASTIEGQKNAIGTQAANTAASTIESQKSAIGTQAASTATATIKKQEDAIAAQAESTATETVKKQEDAIAAQAKSTAEGVVDSKADAIANLAVTNFDEFLQLEPTYKAIYDGMDANEKALLKKALQQAAKSSAKSAAGTAASTTAKDVAEQVAASTAKTTAKTVAQTVAGQVASTTAQTVASTTASQVASTTAQTVASSTASQVANQTAQTVAGQVASSTAQTTATATAKTVANEVKGTAQKQVVSQMTTLGNGLGELTTGLSTINDGTATLAEGANTLAEGIATFNKDGIEKICNYINGDVKDITQRVKKLTELSKQYNNFTMLNGENDGNVKFMMIIDSIKKQEKNESSKEKVVLNDEQK